MKKFHLFFTILLITNVATSQTYIPFPTEVSQWNQLNTWYEGGPWGTYQTLNYQYRMTGDTVIKGITYNKIYRLFDESNPYYIGGLREANKDVFFYPYQSFIEPNINFPSDTTEYLLYSFNNLEVGTQLNINSLEIEISEIDSILFDNIYHRRYTITGSSMLGLEYWIEGIGSTNELFSCYTNEFENDLYTLCFKPDLINPYYISSPDENDWCLYYVGTNDIEFNKLSIYPNPGNEKITVIGEIKEHSQFIITSMTGSILMTGNLDKSSQINTEKLYRGLYSLMIYSGDKSYSIKFLKL